MMPKLHASLLPHSVGKKKKKEKSQGLSRLKGCGNRLYSLWFLGCKKIPERRFVDREQGMEDEQRNRFKHQ